MKTKTHPGHEDSMRNKSVPRTAGRAAQIYLQRRESLSDLKQRILTNAFLSLTNPFLSRGAHAGTRARVAEPVELSVKFSRDEATLEVILKTTRKTAYARTSVTDDLERPRYVLETRGHQTVALPCCASGWTITCEALDASASTEQRLSEQGECALYQLPSETRLDVGNLNPTLRTARLSVS